jgi:hypothetical protein
MKWLGRWLFKIAAEAGQEERNDRIFGNSTKQARISVRDDIDGDDGLNITVRKAIGGRIVTFRHYDHKTDRTSHRLYIIPDELDFERELGKMITLESMRS